MQEERQRIRGGSTRTTERRAGGRSGRATVRSSLPAPLSPSVRRPSLPVYMVAPPVARAGVDPSLSPLESLLPDCAEPGMRVRGADTRPGVRPEALPLLLPGSRGGVRDEDSETAAVAGGAAIGTGGHAMTTGCCPSS